MNMITPPSRRRTEGLLETLDSEGNHLESGKMYILGPEVVIVRQEAIYEGGGIAVEPFSIIEYVTGRTNQPTRRKDILKIESEEKIEEGRKIPYYPSELVPIRQ